MDKYLTKSKKKSKITCAARPHTQVILKKKSRINELCITSCGAILKPMFPVDSITESIELFGVDSFNFAGGSSAPKTVLNVAMQQSGLQSETQLLCGASVIAKNYDRDLEQVLMNSKCFEVLSVNKTGVADDSFIIITYVPYDTTVATTLPFYINGFSYDGIVLGFMVFIMFLIYFFGSLWNKIDGVKNKKTPYNEFIGNNSQDGKIINYD